VASGDEDFWPSHIAGIELIWHRLNREHDLHRFLRSDVHWAECDARLAPSGDIVVSHTAGTRGDRGFADWIEEVAAEGRGAKIDLKESGPVLDGALARVDMTTIEDENVWFNCSVEVIGGRAGFETIRATHPGARISVPVDTLAAWLLTCPGSTELLGNLEAWGVDRLSVSIQTPASREVVRLLDRRGWATNIWDVSTPAQLSDAIDAGPRSITADLGILRPPAQDPAA
jgi:hypothetical protein